jgi:hypothetical protein
VGEARPPRKVARFSGRPRCCGGSVCCSFYGSDGPTVGHVQFVDDSPMVEELWGLLVPAAGYASAWHSVGDDGAGVGGLLRSSPIRVWMVVCCVGCVCFLFLGLFVWWCVLRPVMYHCCLFLYDIAVLLL